MAAWAMAPRSAIDPDSGLERNPDPEVTLFVERARPDRRRHPVATTASARNRGRRARARPGQGQPRPLAPSVPSSVCSKPIPVSLDARAPGQGEREVTCPDKFPELLGAIDLSKKSPRSDRAGGACHVKTTNIPTAWCADYRDLLFAPTSPQAGRLGFTHMVGDLAPPLHKLVHAHQQCEPLRQYPPPVRCGTALIAIWRSPCCWDDRDLCAMPASVAAREMPTKRRFRLSELTKRSGARRRSGSRC